MQHEIKDESFIHDETTTECKNIKKLILQSEFSSIYFQWWMLVLHLMLLFQSKWNLKG